MAKGKSKNDEKQGNVTEIVGEEKEVKKRGRTSNSIPQEVVRCAEFVARIHAPGYPIKGNQAVIGAVNIAYLQALNIYNDTVKEAPEFAKLFEDFFGPSEG